MTTSWLMKMNEMVKCFTRVRKSSANPLASTRTRLSDGSLHRFFGGVCDYKVHKVLFVSYPLPVQISRVGVFPFNRLRSTPEFTPQIQPSFLCKSSNRNIQTPDNRSKMLLGNQTICWPIPVSKGDYTRHKHFDDSHEVPGL